jgi:hypothetical protein
VPRASLTTFASLLSSVIALYGVACYLYYLQNQKHVKTEKEFEQGLLKA